MTQLAGMSDLVHTVDSLVSCKGPYSEDVHIFVLLRTMKSDCPVMIRGNMLYGSQTGMIDLLSRLGNPRKYLWLLCARMVTVLGTDMDDCSRAQRQVLGTLLIFRPDGKGGRSVDQLDDISNGYVQIVNSRLDPLS